MVKEYHFVLLQQQGIAAFRKLSSNARELAEVALKERRLNLSEYSEKFSKLSLWVRVGEKGLNPKSTKEVKKE